MDDQSSPKDPMAGSGGGASQPDDAQTRSALAGTELGDGETGRTEMGAAGAAEPGGKRGGNGGGRGGDGRGGGRVNTSAWLIGILVVLVAVFAGLRYSGRTPTPTRPAPTRPAPTVPAPTPTPTAPAPTLADLRRDLASTETAITRGDWSAAGRQAASLRARWQSLRSRVRSADTTKDVTAFDSRLQKLANDISAKKEADARADIAELRAVADRLQLSPTRASTAG